MAKANGALESVVLNGRRFTCDAESEASVDLSEWDNEVKPNSDGTFRTVKTRHVQKIESLTLEIDVDRGDVDFINEVKAKLAPVPLSATRVDGKTYEGEVMITDSTSLNDNESTMEVTLEGRIRIL